MVRRLPPCRGQNRQGGPSRRCATLEDSNISNALIKQKKSPGTKPGLKFREETSKKGSK
jgi:hypothetical protein